MGVCGDHLESMCSMSLQQFTENTLHNHSHAAAMLENASALKILSGGTIKREAAKIQAGLLAACKSCSSCLHC